MFAAIPLIPEEPHLGCSLAVASAESRSLGVSSREVLAGTLAAVRNTLCETLHDAIAAGELAPDLEVDATADALLALYEGIQVLQRSTVDALKVDATVDVALDGLLPHSTP